MTTQFVKGRMRNRKFSIVEFILKNTFALILIKLELFIIETSIRGPKPSIAQKNSNGNSLGNCQGRDWQTIIKEILRIYTTSLQDNWISKIIMSDFQFNYN